MRDFFEHALAPVRRVRRIHPAAQDGVSSVVLCVLVVALIFQAKPPRFLLGPLLNFAAPPSDTYSAGAPRVVAGSPELDDAPSVVAEVVASTPSSPRTGRAKDRGQKAAGKAKTVAAADGGGSDGGGGVPTTSSGGTTPPAPPPLGPCRGNASANSTKHASSSGLSKGTGHGCG